MSKRYCIICGTEIQSEDPSAVFCPQHSGPGPADERKNSSDHTILESDLEAKPSPTPNTTGNTWYPGQVILGTYEVKEQLGKGGFGTVYRVHHNTWNIDLAVKRALNLSESSKATFINEAEKWIDMGLHPHIISCYYVRNIDGFPHTFAELAEGKSLHDWIEGNGFSLYEGDREQVLARILDVALQFAWGLAYAHEQGLIHQDVKPHNALMTPEGILKVTDFGLAKAGAQSEPGEKADAGKGFLVSGGAYTRAYCSPEQAAGLKLSIKTDIWSWAVSVLEMFCGEIRWLAGQAAATALENYLAHEPEPDIPQMPDDLADLLSECFQNDPAERPADMSNIADRLIEIYASANGQDYDRQTPKPAELRADNLNNKALTMLDIGKPAEAESLLREALEIDGMHPAVTYNLSLLEWRNGDIDDLIAAGRLRQILSTTAKKWPTAYLLAQVEAERGDFQEAVELLRDIEAESDAQRLFAKIQKFTTNIGLLQAFESSHGAVTAIKFSKDGRWAIPGSDRGFIEVWDLVTGECLHSWKAHNGRVTALELTPDGLRILSSSWDYTVKLHDIASESCLRTFEGHQKEVNGVAGTPDGRTAVSGSVDQTIRVWDIDSGKCIRVLEDNMKTVKSVAVSPDGSRILSGSDDDNVRLWSISTGECLLTMTGHQADICDVCFTKDGRYALSACGPYKFDKDNIWLWDLSTGTCIRKYNVLEYWPHELAIHPNGKWFLSGGSDRMLKLWDLKSGKCMHTFEKMEGPVNGLAISFDGKRVLSVRGLYGKGTKETLLWAMEGIDQFHAPFYVATPLTTETVSVHENRYRQLIEETDGLMASGKYAEAQQKIIEIRSIPGFERDGHALGHWFDLYARCHPEELKAEWLENKFELHPNEIYGCDISSDGRFALSACWDKLTYMFSIKTGNLVRTFEGHTYEVCMVKFRKNGNQFISASEDNTLRLWDVVTGECLRIFEGHTEPAECLALSPDDRFVLSSGLDATVRLWDIDSGNCLRVLETGTDFIKSLAFSPDGCKAAFGCGSMDDKKPTLQYWDILKGKCLFKFNDFAVSIWSVAISPDGSKLLAGDEGGKIHLWDLNSFEHLDTFEDHHDEVSALAFSPNGRYFFSGGSDNILRLWDLDESRLVRTLTMHDNSINFITFENDGRHLLTASSDMYIHLWALDWALDDFEPADWDEGARPYLEAFLTMHTPFVGTLPQEPEPSEAAVTAALTHQGKPVWDEVDFQQFLAELGQHGFGWLREEGVRVKLQELAALR